MHAHTYTLMHAHACTYIHIDACTCLAHACTLVQGSFDTGIGLFAHASHMHAHLEQEVKEVAALTQLHDQVQLVSRRVAVSRSGFRLWGVRFKLCGLV